MWTNTKIKNKHYTALKVLGRGKVNKGLEIVIKEYNCNNPRIRKLLKDIYDDK